METIKQEKLLFNRPIEIEGLGTIYQPKMKDFVDNNFNISDMIRAFHINIKLVIPNADELRLSDFDLFFLQLHQTDKLEHLLIVDLIRSLEMLYKTSNIKVNIDNNEIKINDEYILNRDNYKLLCSYIMIIFDLDVNSIEKQQAKSAIELKIEQKRREFEKKKKENNPDKEDEGYTLFDLANYIIHCDNTNYTYDNILDLTIYQLKNTYNMYKKKENYQLYIDYKCGGFKMDTEEPHWFFNKK